MKEFLEMPDQLPTLLIQVRDQLAENSKLLAVANEQLGNMRYYETDAAKYLGVENKTMYHYRERGLPYEKVGRIVSYRRKDLDEWRSNGRVRKHGV